MEKKTSHHKNVLDYYEKRAKTHSDFKATGNWKNDKEIPIICKEICEKINLNKNENILEVGCGSGILGSWIKQNCNFYVGLDISNNLLKQFKETEKLHSKPNIIQSTSDSIPLSKGSFDKVVMNSVTMFLNDHILTKTFEEIERVVKPNGLLYIGDNVVPSSWLWELSWYNNLPRFLQILVKPYAQIRRKIAKKYPKLGGKWKSTYHIVSKNFIEEYFQRRGIILESESATNSARKQISQKYKGNRRRDFIINLNQ